jgi:monovalent cation/hydrogen antiporter
MTVFELVLFLLLGGVGLTLLASRLGLAGPVLLAVAGVGLAFIPGVPVVVLDPKLALALFVAPVLLDAAYDTSPRDLRDNWVPVASLVLVAVGVTVAAVAFTAHRLMPTMPWAAAVALGAIVAPPDAASATTILRQVQLPHRLTVILEGESLLNDASALLIYRLAVGAVAGGITLWTGPLLILACIGGIVLGIAAARLSLAVTARIVDGPAAVVMQFLGTFGVWLLADALDLSAILTIVAYAITLARRAPEQTGARQRRSSYAVWDVAVFVLNILAFIMVGLQLRGIISRLNGQAGTYVVFASAVLAVTIIARFLWVMSFNTALRWKIRVFGTQTRRPLLRPTVQGGLVISWCGMRGIVTLAAALALPGHFPERDLIVFTASCVVLGTLVLQGLTLRPLVARLALPRDQSVEDEVDLARIETARAALEALGAERQTKAGHILAQAFEARLAGEPATEAVDGLTRLRQRTLLAERQCLAKLRRDGRIGDDAFHRLEEDLDWAAADAE